MSTKKQRRRLAERRMEFDKAVEKARIEQEEKRKEQEKLFMLEGLTKTELIKYAEDNGIEIDKTAKKSEILKKVKE